MYCNLLVVRIILNSIEHFQENICPNAWDISERLRRTITVLCTCTSSIEQQLYPKFLTSRIPRNMWITSRRIRLRNPCLSKFPFWSNAGARFRSAAAPPKGLPFRTSALRGEGVPSKADIVCNLSKGRCVNLRTRGGGGQKIRNLCGCPLWKPPIHL